MKTDNTTVKEGAMSRIQEYLDLIETKFVEKLSEVRRIGENSTTRDFKQKEGIGWHTTHRIFVECMREVAETVEHEVREEYRKKLKKILED